MMSSNDRGIPRSPDPFTIAHPGAPVKGNPRPRFPLGVPLGVPLGLLSLGLPLDIRTPLAPTDIRTIYFFVCE